MSKSEEYKDCLRFATQIQDLLYHGIINPEDLMYPTLHEEYLDNGMGGNDNG